MYRTSASHGYRQDTQRSVGKKVTVGHQHGFRVRKDGFYAYRFGILDTSPGPLLDPSGSLDGAPSLWALFSTSQSQTAARPVPFPVFDFITPCSIIESFNIFAVTGYGR